MKQYCVYTNDFPHTPGLFTQLSNAGITIDPHIARTRFWLDLDNAQHRWIWLKYSDYMHDISHETDHATGC